MKRISKEKTIKGIIAIIFIIALLTTLFFILYPTIKISNYDKYLNSLKIQKETYGMQSLKNKNSDFVAWLECQDVDVSIPVVVSSNDFYLNHDFDKAKNNLGSPYHYSTSTLGQSFNTTIIGHSAYNTKDMNGKIVFQAIMGNFNNYINETDSTNYNYKITVETLTETLTYQVFSAFSYDSNADCNNEKNLFYTTNITTQQEFDNYINLANNLSQKDFGQTATFGDKFLTLYTCSYESGYRIMIIAKQIEN